MSLLDSIDAGHREHVRARLDRNLIAWFTTVTPRGRPAVVPVWFLWRDDETVLLYSQRLARKLTNIAANPSVVLALDVSDLGRDTVRINGEAAADPSQPPAAEVDAYLAKYAERMAALFGTRHAFSQAFSVPIVITPTRVLSPPPSPGVT